MCFGAKEAFGEVREWLGPWFSQMAKVKSGPSILRIPAPIRFGHPKKAPLALSDGIIAT
jgi:hypothetical protein